MTFKKHNVAGSVTLYNSEIQVFTNIHSYLSQIDHLFVIDNSEILNNELVERIKAISNVTYVPNEANLGVAYALNQAAEMAITAGYQYLLTMDDDTYFPVGGIQEMLFFINQRDARNIGIIAGQPDPKFIGSSIRSALFTITSGSLLSLTAYKECGPFMNELFIDCVDHEYCFRMKQCGFEILEINNIRLNHRLGQEKQLVLLNYKIPFFWLSHNPLRVYYKTRNSIFSLKKYKSLVIKIKYIYYKEICKDLFKIIFLENKKKTRLLLLIRGVYDGLMSNLGKRNFEI